MPKDPKNSEKYYWTEHAKMKMRHYGLSGQRITRVIRRPLRMESAIVDGMIAVMQPQSMRRAADGSKTWTSEIWVMYKIVTPDQKNADDKKHYDAKMYEFLARVAQVQKQIRIVSVWRYPGKTEPGEGLPEEIMSEIAEV